MGSVFYGITDCGCMGHCYGILSNRNVDRGLSMNLAEVLILVAVGAYVLFVIIKKVKNIKRGNDCSCQCEHCMQPCKQEKTQSHPSENETTPPTNSDALK